jgi:magnesium transporter
VRVLRRHKHRPPGEAPAPGSAAALATTHVPVCSPTEEVGAARLRLTAGRYDDVRDVPVCRDGRLQGLVRIEALLAADPRTRVGSLMDRDPPRARAHADPLRSASRAAHRGESSVAVVDDDGRFVGLVPAHRLLRVLLAAHDQDLARISGSLASSRASTAAQEPVLTRVWHRLPWLLVGLAGAFATAGVMSSFEDRLAANVTIAFFVPGIVYMADAVGTQTETLVIRGLSLGVSVRKIAARELVTGLLVGVLLGLAFLAVGLLLWQDTTVVPAVALAVFAACATATVVAMTLPWALARLGTDPAFGSGPLATAIQDLLSLLLYFAIVAMMVLG